MTEDKEFMDIYGMDVVEIPTNKPMIRVDKDDSIYMTKKEKLNAVINEIVEAHEKGQPVLVAPSTLTHPKKSAACSPKKASSTTC